MSQFLKLKTTNGQRLLLNAGTVVSVSELKDGCRVETAADAFDVKEGYQTLVNRLTKGGDEASA